MKKLLLSLVVLATIFSCGKKNTVGSTSTSLSSSLSTSQTAVTLANAINNNSFATTSYPFFYFYTGTATTSAASSGSSCKTWTIFSFCTYSTSSSSYSVSSLTNKSYTLLSTVDVASKKSSLMSIVNSVTDANYIYQSGNGIYQVFSGTKTYTINTNYPIQMNPISVSDSSTGTVTFVYNYIYGAYPATSSQLSAYL